MIKINLNKAKKISHDKRRIIREKLFKPLDLMSTIPSKAKLAEEERSKVRDKDNIVQQDIDKATSPEELKQILEGYSAEI